MKVIFLILITSSFLQGCTSQPSNKHVYNWISFEDVPRDSFGRVNGGAIWKDHLHMKSPYDTFVFYKSNDSIRMISTDAPEGSVFVKTNIRARRWKPKPDYYNTFFLLGTYTRKDLGGIYASFYATKDRNDLLQVWYTNPGNLTNAILFSKDSVNIFQQKGLVIDQKDDLAESEEIQVKFNN